MNPATAAQDTLVDVRDLQVTFTGGTRPVRAVDGVDLQVRRGEVLALIGESGSGKSVTLRSLLRLHPPQRSQISGQIKVGGADVLALSGTELADYRGKVASMIFQEPLLALDPVYTVGAQIVESQMHAVLSPRLGQPACKRLGTSYCACGLTSHRFDTKSNTTTRRLP